MGTWGVSKKELVSRLVECLDNTEGDFDTETLLEALEFLKDYCPTSDSKEFEEKRWRKDLMILEGDE